jgi:hypothetical protein
VSSLSCTTLFSRIYSTETRKMMFNVLLAALPSVALGAQLAYSPPPALMAFSQAADDCIFPANYEVRQFGGLTNSTRGTTLESFDFSFASLETEVTTPCHFNSTSESSTPPGRTPRYSCENSDVEFIWESDKRQLWMVERVCPGSDGYVWMLLKSDTFH